MMQTSKIASAEFELDMVSGELQTMHNLLNIFANWFEETHKTDDLIRPRNERYVSRLWDEAPMYDSILCTLFGSISGLEKEVNAIIDESNKEISHV